VRAEPVGEDQFGAVPGHADSEEHAAEAALDGEAEQVAVERFGGGEPWIGHLQLDVPCRGALGEAGERQVRAGLVGEVTQVHRVRDGGRLVARPLPLVARSGAGDLDGVAVGVGDVAGVRQAVVDELIVRFPGGVVADEPGEVGPGGHQRCDVAQAGTRRQRSHRTGFLSEGDECPSWYAQPGPTGVVVEHLHADGLGVVGEAAFQVGDGQVDGAEFERLVHVRPPGPGR
jgi:hypothetical protein